MIDLVFLLIIFVSGVAAGLVGGAVFAWWREPMPDIPEWDESYFRDERPRAVTRIHSNDLDWEIK
jgi:hypothetical protein